MEGTGDGTPPVSRKRAERGSCAAAMIVRNRSRILPGVRQAWFRGGKASILTVRRRVGEQRRKMTTVGIEKQLGDVPEFNRLQRLQELFDENTKAQLDTGDLLVKLRDRKPDEVVTVEEFSEVVALALAGAQSARQAIIEIHFALAGEPPKGA